MGMNVYKVSGFAFTQDVLWVESRRRDCQDFFAILLFFVPEYKQTKQVSTIFHNIKPDLSLLTILILILWSVYYVLR